MIQHHHVYTYSHFTNVASRNLIFFDFIFLHSPCGVMYDYWTTLIITQIHLIHGWPPSILQHIKASRGWWETQVMWWIHIIANDWGLYATRTT